LTGDFFRAVFVALAGSALAPSALTRSHRFLVAATIRFIPSLLIRRLGFDDSAVAFDRSFERLTGGFFAFLEGACELRASFARVTAAFASSSASRIPGALAEYRSITLEINASILAGRLRALFAFIDHSPLTILGRWKYNTPEAPTDCPCMNEGSNGPLTPEWGTNNSVGKTLYNQP
jgi:hypothetical protein